MSAHLIHFSEEDSSPQQLVEVPVEESAHYIILTTIMCQLFLLLKLHQTVFKCPHHSPPESQNPHTILSSTILFQSFLVVPLT